MYVLLLFLKRGTAHRLWYVLTSSQSPESTWDGYCSVLLLRHSCFCALQGPGAKRPDSNVQQNKKAVIICFFSHKDIETEAFLPALTEAACDSNRVDSAFRHSEKNAFYKCCYCIFTSAFVKSVPPGFTGCCDLFQSCCKCCGCNIKLKLKHPPESPD